MSRTSSDWRHTKVEVEDATRQILGVLGDKNNRSNETTILYEHPRHLFTPRFSVHKPHSKRKGHKMSLFNLHISDLASTTICYDLFVVLTLKHHPTIIATLQRILKYPTLGHTSIPIDSLHNTQVFNLTPPSSSCNQLYHFACMLKSVRGAARLSYLLVIIRYQFLVSVSWAF